MAIAYDRITQKLIALLFDTARRQQKKIYFHDDRLSCNNPGVLLTRLLALYNEFCRADIKAFLQEDIKMTQQAEQQFRAQFLLERKQQPLASSFHLPVEALSDK